MTNPEYKYSHLNITRMASDGLSINTTVISIIAVSIGVVLIGSLLAPIASDVMAQLTATDAGGNPVYENGGTWSSLIGVVVVMAILGLVIVAVNNYTKKN